MKNRITAAMLAVIMLVLPLGTGLVVHKSHQMILERERTRALSEEAAISRSIYKEIKDGGYEQLLKTAQSMQAKYGSDVLSLILYYQGSPIGQEAQSNDLAKLLDTKERSTLLDADNALFYVAHRIRDEVVLLAVSNVSSVYELHRQLIVWAVLLCVICMAAGASMSMALSGLLLRPLRALAQAAAALRRGEYGAALPQSPMKEVAELNQTFEAMKSAVQKREDALKEQAAQKQQLLEALSHEMRTPLTALTAGTELLQNAKLPQEKQYALLHTMAQEAKRLMTMDERLLLLTDLTHRKIEMTTFSLEKMAQEAAGVFQHVEIDSSQVQNLHTELTGQRGLLIELMRNLIVNAERAGITKSVRLILHPNGFSVQDDGCGMTQEQMKHMFDAFYKADQSRSRKAGGAGLGLTICMKIAQLHHAQLSVQSRPGDGTIVTYSR